MLGCLGYEMCCLKRPFESSSLNDLFKSIISSEPNAIPERFSSDLRNLITSMMKKSPSDRPTIEDVCSNKKVAFYLGKYITQSEPSPTKILDRHKLQINIEEEETSPDSRISDFKFNSKFFMNGDARTQAKKYTPSYGRNEMTKLLKNMEISPINTPIQMAPQFLFHNLPRQPDSRRQSNTSSSTSHSQVDSQSRPLYKTPTQARSNNSNYRQLSTKKGHIRQISVNITSIQSPEHKAVYSIDRIEGMKNVEFPKPGNKPEFTKITLTPTNIPNKIPNKMNKVLGREVPNSTKVSSSNMRYEPGAVLGGGSKDNYFKESLIKKFGKEKVQEMLDSVTKNNNIINEEKIKTIAGEDHKQALSYVKYLLGI